MAEPKGERLGLEAFLLWAAARQERFELLDGKTCEPFGADTAVVTPNGNVRLPDAGVDCGQSDNEDRPAKEPVLGVEVLPPSTRGTDLHADFEENRAIPSMRQALIVDPERAWATHWERGPGRVWSERTIVGLQAAATMPDLGLVLPFAAPYARVEFPPRPRRVT